MTNFRLFSASLSAILCTLLLFTGQSHALSIGPEDAVLTGLKNNVPEIKAEIALTIPDFSDLAEIYKSDVVEGGLPSESGVFAGSYKTTFLNDPNDPQDADIEYTGGPVAAAEYLLVKDGDQVPAWYLFNLTTIDGGQPWNGTEILELRGFWPDNGAISHVAFYGERSIPEPSTMFLLGIGLVGLVGVTKKVKK